MGLAEFIYTTILKPRPLRLAANQVIRMLIPEMTEVRGARVVLNRKDPVVCGALALRLYEKDEINFLSRAVKPGMTVLDIGANIGLYTAILGRGIGPAGRLFSFEPDPENFQYLSRTVSANGFQNVQLVPAAASAAPGTMRLYTSSENRGDNRLYSNELADGYVEVEVVRADDYLAERNVSRVDLIKIDVQGFEAYVLAGLEQTLRNSSPLILLSEFWPDGLRRAGSDPLDLLQKLQDWGLQLHTLEPGGTIAPVLDCEQLIARFPGRKYTNIVGLKGQAAPF